MSTLAESAQHAAAEFPDSDVELAIAFMEKALPEFVGTSNDRLVKVGRSVKSLVEMAEDLPLETSLELLVEECRLLISGKVKVPKVKFGKTDLEISQVTLGCMRFQQEWGPRITKMNQIGSDCQDNLVAILKQAFDFGINHIETARGYGCSELQLGAALKQLFLTDQVKREDLIIQTKIPAMAKASDFREALETSFRNLQVEYVDLFAFHGMNFAEQFGWVFDGEDNCLAVIKEFMAAGKIRHIGLVRMVRPISFSSASRRMFLITSTCTTIILVPTRPLVVATTATATWIASSFCKIKAWVSSLLVLLTRVGDCTLPRESCAP
jgi:hypothetical protein